MNLDSIAILDGELALFKHYTKNNRVYRRKWPLPYKLHPTVLENLITVIIQYSINNRWDVRIPFKLRRFLRTKPKSNENNTA